MTTVAETADLEIPKARIPRNALQAQSGIYFLFLRGEVVYVGRTNNFAYRMSGGDHQAKAWDEAAFKCMPVAETYAAEAAYVDALQPKLNVLLRARTVRTPKIACRTLLTDAAVMDAAVGEKLFDTRVVGLHLRTGPQSRAFYVFYRDQHGKPRRPKLGDAPRMSVDTARALAARILSDVRHAKLAPTLTLAAMLS